MMKTIFFSQLVQNFGGRLKSIFILGYKIDRSRVGQSESIVILQSNEQIKYSINNMAIVIQCRKLGQYRSFNSFPKERFFSPIEIVYVHPSLVTRFSHVCGNCVCTRPSCLEFRHFSHEVSQLKQKCLLRYDCDNQQTCDMTTIKTGR